MNKKQVALLTAVLMFIGTLAACTNAPAPTPAATPAPAAQTATATPAPATQAPAATPEPGPQKLLENPITVEMWQTEHVSYLYTKDLLVERIMGDRCNVFFNVTPFPDGTDGGIEKINLGLASGDLPDIYHMCYVRDASNWGMQGALVDFSKHFDEMPNYSAWASAMGDYPYYFYSGDGAMYVTPNYGFGTASNSTFWMYRKDIFEEHNLSVPNNEDELYEVCKTLKELYPDSYPFLNRGLLDLYDRLAYQWGTGYPIYYNNSQKAWVYGPTEDKFKESIEWSAKMFAEELIPINGLTMDVPTWQEYVFNNRGFVLSQYQAQIDILNVQMRQDDPSVDWNYMRPFEGGGSGIRTFNPQTQLIMAGYCLFSTSQYIPEIIKFYDWMYTDEAKELMSWGIEGESFTVNPDGSKSHIGITPGVSGSFDVIHMYGFFNRGFFCLTDPLAHITYASKETLAAVENVIKDAGEYRVPVISFNEERLERFNILNPIMIACTTENLGKFITGQRPLAEYDAYIDELYSLGLEEFVKIHNDQQAETNAMRGK